MPCAMPFYARLGEIPSKRHIQFRRPNGELFREEVMGMEGFSGIQSILYHHHHPTAVRKVESLGSAREEFLDYGPLRARQFRTREFPKGGDALESKRVLLGNDDVTLAISRPSSEPISIRNISGISVKARSKPVSI